MEYVMSKKWLSVAAGVVCILILTACGDGVKDIWAAIRGTEHSGSVDEQQSAGPGIQQGVLTGGEENEGKTNQLSAEEEALIARETKYSTEGLDASEYKELAQKYADKGLRKKQRDMLEQCWRFYGDAEAFITLQEITVNAQEEDESLRKKAELLICIMRTMMTIDILLVWEWESIKDFALELMR